MKKLSLLLLVLSVSLCASADDSGSCGENVSYTYSETAKTLTISGFGEMNDFTATSQPWYVYNSDIQKIVIENGVKNIGGYAFANFTGLSSVIIPQSIISIGRSAFMGCNSLTSLYLPEGVEIINISAFQNCSSLSEIYIPNSIKTINIKAFSSCKNIEKVYIIDITSWCKINFQGGGSNPLVYAKHLYINGEEICDLVIPENITTIEKNAFNGCSSIVSLKISNSVTSIGSSAFSGCTGLTSIEIPNSLTNISDYAFSGCTGLTSIEIPNSVTSIGRFVFSGCTGLTSIEIPNSLTNISDFAFEDCINLTSVIIPNSVTSIGAYAFGHCYILKKVYCYAEEIPSTDYSSYYTSFYETPINEAKLYVPENSITKYQSIYPWSGFGEIAKLEENQGENANTEEDEINANIDCVVKWNDSWSHVVTPWNDTYYRGVDIIIKNLLQEDIKIIKIERFINASKMELSSDMTDIRINSGELKSISFTLEGSSEPTTLPWLKIYYKLGNKDYIKVVNNSEITSILNIVNKENVNMKNIYTLNGYRLNHLRKGLNIVRMSNGKTKKVLVK